MNALRNTEINKFIKDIHEDNDTSYITVANRNKSAWNQVHCLGYESATTHIITLRESEIQDIYHSNNSFFRPQRGEATLFNLNALYLDIDWHDAKEQIDHNRVIEYLNVVYFNRKVPLPSYIVATGRGLQLYWRIETAPKQAIFLWKLVQSRMAQALANISEFEAGINVDMSCVNDVARVFRVPNTFNTKSQTYARVVQYSENAIYTLSEIRDTYYKDLYKDSDRLLSKSRKRNQNIIANRFFNKLNLQQSRIEDLLLLLEMRAGDMVGCRDKFLFVYGWTLVGKRATEEVFVRELVAVNELFKDPLPYAEISYKARHIYKKYKSKVLKKDNPTQFYEYFDVYIFRNDTIIKYLDITEQEQKSLKTIIAKREKYDRNNERRQTERRNKAGLTKREQKYTDNLNAVKKLLEQGLKQKEIVIQIGMSKSRVSELVKIIKEQN